MERIKPGMRPLSIGSFPYKDPDRAMDMILKYYPEAPCWAQLPSIGSSEQMYVQFYDGIPGITFDNEKKKLVASPVDDDFFIKMAEVFEKIMEEDLDYFSLPDDKARGLYHFIKNADKIQACSPRRIKGQITGPVSFSLVVTDTDMKPILYDESYRETVAGVFKMKALWQLEELKKVHPHVLMFIDEPYMASVGSSMVSISTDAASEMISTVAQAIKEKGGVAGVHCCGNTDWGALLKSGCDVVSFDAYEYGENFLLYADEAAEFIKSGGCVAWGIVPTSDDVERETAGSLAEKLLALMDRLSKTGLAMGSIRESAFITPACGLGNVEPEKAERIMRLNRELFNLMAGKT